MSASKAASLSIEGFRAFLAEHRDEIFGDGNERLCPVACYVRSIYPGARTGGAYFTVPLRAPVKTKGKVVRHRWYYVPAWARVFISWWDGLSRPMTGAGVLTSLNNTQAKRRAA